MMKITVFNRKLYKKQENKITMIKMIKKAKTNLCNQENKI